MSAAANRLMPVLLVFALAALALLAPFDHDEDQYFAAARLVSSGWPYRDWAYLQTPLFPFWGAAVTAPFGEYALTAGRLSQALLAALLLWVFARTLRALDVPHRMAGWTTLALACCTPLLFSATVFRNDMLAAVLMTAGFGLIAARGRDPMRVTPTIAFAAGALICAAASVKVTYGFIGIAPLLWLTIVPISWRDRLVRIAALGLGALIGLLPILIAFAAEPQRFMFQAVTFGAQAPLDWYRAMGQEFRLGWLGRLRDGALIMVMGAQGFALALAAWHRWSRGKHTRDRSLLLLLDLAIVVTLIAAVIPVPSWRQYFLVLLPPLFLRLPFALMAMSDTARRYAVVGITLFSIAGLGVFAGTLAKTARDPERAFLTRQQESHWLGRELAAAGLSGVQVATLSPHVVIDSGGAIDPGLAAGPFVFRWTDPAHQGDIAASNALTANSYAAAFAAAPPAAIVTGYETRANGSSKSDLDAHFRDWARANGYVERQSPHGDAVLFLRR